MPRVGRRQCYPAMYERRQGPQRGQELLRVSATKVRERVPLLDHLIGAGEQRGRDGKPKRLGGGYVDDEVELRRLLNW